MAPDSALVRARRGDPDAFRELVDPFHAELRFHCYSIVGSVQDAEDLLQETLLAAWQGLAQFEGRSSVRAWLYRIATNRCLNALRDRKRRPRKAEPVDLPEPTRRSEVIWLDPYPDVLLEGMAESAPGPEARFEMREAVELAFVTALQHLPPRQRAVLLLRDVLGFRTDEVASMLGTSAASVKSALRRARDRLDAWQSTGGTDRGLDPGRPRERELAGQFADAVERGDIDAIVSLLTEDAWLTMPPEPVEYQGTAIAEFLRQRIRQVGAPFRLIPVRANRQPAFGCYVADPHARVKRAYGILVLTLGSDRVSAISWFGDRALFPHFGLPRTLPE